MFWMLSNSGLLVPSDAFTDILHDAELPLQSLNAHEDSGERIVVEGPSANG
jgi:hypothetical protein